MPVAIQMPQRREQKDPLDTILKGLNIAASVYGIKEAREKSDNLAKQTKLEEEKVDLLRQQAKDQRDAKQRELLAAEDKETTEAFSKGVIRTKDPTGKWAHSWDPNYKPKSTTDPVLAGLRMDDLKSRIEERKQKTLDSGAERLSGAIQNAGELNSAIKNIEKKLGISLDDYNGEKVDLAGVNWPGVGRISFYDKGARTLDSAIASVFNVELKDRSGAAVTTPELERLRTEFGAGRFNTEEELLGALRDYKMAFRDAVADIEAGYSPEVVALRQERGGFTSAAIPQGKGASAPKFNMNNTAGPLNVMGLPSANAGQSFVPDQQIVNDAAAELIRRRGLKAAPLPKGTR